MVKVIYKPFGLASSAVGGAAASYLFKVLWMRIAHEGQAPRATQQDRAWKEVLAAAAIQGAIFGLVKAAVDRAGVAGFQRATGVWPAD